MREIAIIGIGQTAVSEHWDKSLRELAGEAILAALFDAHRETVDALFVSNMMGISLNHQASLGAHIADWVGLRGIEAYRVEAACGSGASALRAGMIAVASGELDSVLVAGVEKMTDVPPSTLVSELATAADADWEGAQGVSFVAINALIMQRYMHVHGWQRRDFAPFSINAHANALHNPNARLHMEVTHKSYEKSRIIAEPISVLDAASNGDGAAAVLLVPADTLHSNGRPKIVIAGSGAATDTISVHDRKDPLWLNAGYLSAQRAYHQAGVLPADIDLFELHDAFSIMAALSLEAAGFAEYGQGPRLGLEGEITLTGRVPITTRGGLKARGHPVGATGIYQIVEVVEQLRGEAGGSQVEGARLGMAQNIGGSGATIVTHILRKT